MAFERRPACSNYTDPRVWICPKKRRGLTYKTEPGSFDPTITGFLSYGFNYLGVFGGDGGQNRPSVPARSRAPDVVAVTEVNGSDNPKKSAAVSKTKRRMPRLAGRLLGCGFVPLNKRPWGNQNYRFQSQWKKHNQR